MPLSNEERKELEEMERELNLEDPQLAEELTSGWVGSPLTVHSVCGALTVLIGMLVLIAGIATQLTVFGVGGFLLMGTGAYWLVSKPVFRSRSR